MHPLNMCALNFHAIKKTVIFSLFFGLSLIFSSPSWAASPTVELEKLLNQITSLSAKFEQLTQDGRGLKIQQSEGEMHLAKPQLFYWHTQEPYEQLIVSNGEHMWVYEPDLEQVTQQAIDEQLQASPAYLIISQAENLGKHYQITQRQQAGKQVFTLRPKIQESLFEELQLTFTQQQISSLQLTDSLGQKTLIDLHSTQVNQPINSQLFNFTPPEGVDLINQVH